FLPHQRPLPGSEGLPGMYIIQRSAVLNLRRSAGIIKNHVTNMRSTTQGAESRDMSVGVDGVEHRRHGSDLGYLPTYLHNVATYLEKESRDRSVIGYKTSMVALNLPIPHYGPSLLKRDWTGTEYVASSSAPLLASP